MAIWKLDLGQRILLFFGFIWLLSFPFQTLLSALKVLISVFIYFWHEIGVSLINWTPLLWTFGGFKHRFLIWCVLWHRWTLFRFQLYRFWNRGWLLWFHYFRLFCLISFGSFTPFRLCRVRNLINARCFLHWAPIRCSPSSLSIADKWLCVLTLTSLLLIPENLPRSEAHPGRICPLGGELLHFLLPLEPLLLSLPLQEDLLISDELVDISVAILIVSFDVRLEAASLQFVLLLNHSLPI